MTKKGAHTQLAKIKFFLVYLGQMNNYELITGGGGGQKFPLVPIEEPDSARRNSPTKPACLHVHATINHLKVRTRRGLCELGI